MRFHLSVFGIVFLVALFGCAQMMDMDKEIPPREPTEVQDTQDMMDDHVQEPAEVPTMAEQQGVQEAREAAAPDEEPADADLSQDVEEFDRNLNEFLNI